MSTLEHTTATMKEVNYLTFRALGFDMEQALALCHGDNMHEYLSRDWATVGWEKWTGVTYYDVSCVRKLDFWDALVFRYEIAQDRQG